MLKTKKLEQKENRKRNQLNKSIISFFTYDFTPKHLHNNKIKLTSFRALQICYLSMISIFVLVNLIFMEVNINEVVKDGDEYILIEMVWLFFFLFDLMIKIWIFKQKNPDKNKLLFFKTFNGFMAIIFLVPSITIFGILIPNMKIWIYTVLFQIRGVRVFKILGFILLFEGFKILTEVLKKNQDLIIIIFWIITVVILVFAYLIYIPEKDANNPNINNYWDALYYSVISMTTIGFGDVSPITGLGKAITSVAAILGVLIFAIPTGIVAGAFMAEFNTIKVKTLINKKNIEKVEDKSMENIKKSENISKENIKKSENISKENIKKSENVSKQNIKKSENISKQNIKKSENISKQNIKKSENIFKENIKKKKGLN